VRWDETLADFLDEPHTRRAWFLDMRHEQETEDERMTRYCKCRDEGYPCSYCSLLEQINTLAQQIEERVAA
jgi:hypothetical protein